MIQNSMDLLQHLAPLDGCSLFLKSTEMAYYCRAITTGHMLTSILKTFSFTSVFVRVMSLFQLAGSLHIGHVSISLVLIIGFLIPVSNDQDF